MKSVALRALTLVSAFTALGCGGGRGDVTGTVSYKGKPVIFGSVTFVGSDGLMVKGGIGPDGTYTVKQVPAGENQIGVNSPDPRDVYVLHPNEIPVDVKQWFPLPQELGDPRKSRLRFDVQSGPNTYNIELQ